jgi:hypothetical protein
MIPMSLFMPPTLTCCSFLSFRSLLLVFTTLAGRAFGAASFDSHLLGALSLDFQTQMENRAPEGYMHGLTGLHDIQPND